MRVTAAHWSHFLDICERNEMCNALITNKCVTINARQELKVLWQQVAEELNGLGLGHKTVEEWRRTVTDWKSKTKAKWLKLHKEIKITGGGSCKNIYLSDIEQRLLSLMGTKCLEGDKGILELGVPQMISTEKQALAAEFSVENMEDVEDVVSISAGSVENYVAGVAGPSNIQARRRPIISRPVRPTRQRRSFSVRKNDEMQKQLSKMQDDTIRLLTSINDNTNRIATSLEEFVRIYKQAHS